MKKINRIIRKAERDAAVADAVARALATLRLLHMGRLQVEENGLVIELGR